MSEQSMALNQAVTATALPDAVMAELRNAALKLQRGNGVLVRLADLMGGVMGRSVRLGARTIGLAPDLQDKVKGVAGAAIAQAFDLAVIRMGDTGHGAASRPDVTRAVVMMSGAVGGFLGLGGFLPDVAVTTLTIMRSIARIAQEEGEDLSEDETRQACLEVFALTPGTTEKGESDFGYYSARLLMQGRPVVMLITEIAGKYGLSISQKLAVQAVPVVGAIGGAALNAAFLRHYQDIARAHFTVRRLERLYGAQNIHDAWISLSAR